MGGSRSNGQGRAREQRRALAEQLRQNSAELEEAIFDRICALEASASQDRRDLRGVKSVVRSALRYGADSVEHGERHSPHPPPAVIEHARKAAWRSVPLQTLHDRYFAAYSVFQHFLLRESDSIEVARQIQTSLDVAYQQLTRVVAEEHNREQNAAARATSGGSSACKGWFGRIPRSF